MPSSAARVRERAGVDRPAARRAPSASSSASALAPRRRRRRARPRRAAPGREVRGRERVQARPRPARASDRRRPPPRATVACRPRQDAVLREARGRCATQSTGVSPIASASSLAPCRASPSDFTASTTRSASRTTSSFVPPVDAELRRRLARASGVARADHDLVPERARAAPRARGRSCPSRRRSRPSRGLERSLEHGLGEPAARVGVAHQRPRHDRPDAERGERSAPSASASSRTSASIRPA